MPSDLQLAFKQWFEHPELNTSENLVGRARAGTGKTSTILWAIGFAPEKSILLAAFNKRNQEDLAARLTNPNAVAKTLHSLGYAAIRSGYGYIRTCKRFEREEAIADAVTGGMGFGAKRLVGKLVTKAREICPLATDVDTMVDLAEEFGMVPNQRDGYTVEQIAMAALRGLAWAKDPKSALATGIDFADMIFLPLINDYQAADFDLVVIDEAQDMTSSQLTLAMRACKVGGRIVLIGDDRQAIYGFRGADSGSLDRLKGALEADELPLSKTYRCPKSVVAIAKRYVPDYQVDESAPLGVVDDAETLDALVSEAKPGDFVLSRRNAPLARVVLRFLREGRAARIVGRDIGTALKALVKQLATGDASHSVPAFLRKLHEYEERTRKRMIAEKHSHRIDEMSDKCGTLSVLAEDVRSVPALVAKIDELFVEDLGQYVICSSVHKAKGLEAERVFVLQSTFFMPAPCATCKQRQRECTCREGYEPDQAKLKEEDNIFYVAITRTKQHLTICREKF